MTGQARRRPRGSPLSAGCALFVILACFSSSYSLARDALPNLISTELDISDGGSRAPVEEEPATRFGILGSFEFKTMAPSFSSRWQGLVARYRKEQPRYSACTGDGERCPAKLREWRIEIEKLRGLPAKVLLQRVNRFVNKFALFSDDKSTFGVSDHWATPLEFAAGRGDCEDFAIFKYFNLLELGFPDEKTRMVIVRDTRRGLLHAVVVVELEGRRFVLDSLDDRVLEHDQMLHYSPISSFNLSDTWTHIVTDQIRMAFLAQINSHRTGPQRVSKAPPTRTSEKIIEESTLYPIEHGNMDTLFFDLDLPVSDSSLV